MDLLAGVEGFEYGCGNLFYFPLRGPIHFH